MNITAVICEYNPFHSGHAHHLLQARRATGAKYLICVMSGSWMQRGEPAVVDKWTRARMALEHGADLVIELPAAHAVRAARDFAVGAVRQIAALNVCTHLCFGSELPLDTLERELACGEDAESVQAALARGESYPRAVSTGEVFSMPNATLGVEYLRALREFGGDIRAVAVPRDRNMASASEIRAAVKAGAPVEALMPPAAYELFQNALERQGGSACWDSLAPLALHKLREVEPGGLESAYGISEGLDRRFLRAAATASTVDELFAAIKTKRYTHARIRRALSHILLETTQVHLSALPSYARVLGFQGSAAALLTAINRASLIPLITKLPKEVADPQLQMDIRAQEFWALACPRAMPAQMDRGQSIIKATCYCDE